MKETLLNYAAFLTYLSSALTASCSDDEEEKKTLMDLIILIMFYKNIQPKDIVINMEKAMWKAIKGDKN